MRRETGALRRDLSAIRADGIASSIMLGAGETYFAAFALALGTPVAAVGLLGSLPLLAGAFVQLVTPYAVNRLGSYRRWVVGCAIAQAASFAPLAVGALAGRLPFGVILALATLYWCAGLASGPAWNAWVGDLVPARVRAPYWAWRTLWAQAAVLAGILLGGLVLARGTPVWGPVAPFALLFLLAGIGRAVAAGWLSRQSESCAPPPRDASMPERRTIGLGSTLTCVLVAQVGVQIAGPYFTPYLLHTLGFSYGAYVLLLTASHAARIASLPLLGRLAQKRGAMAILRVGALGIVPLPLLWLISPSVPWLVCVHLLSGAAWAAYELGIFLLLTEATRPDERAPRVALYTLAHATATVGGAVLGGFVLRAAGAGPGAFAILFAASSLIRGLALRRTWRAPAPALEPATPAAPAAPRLALRTEPVRIGFDSAPENIAIPAREAVEV